MKDVIHQVPYIRQTKGGGILDRDSKRYFQTTLPYSSVKNTTISRAGCGLCATAAALWWATGTYVSPTTLMDRFAGSSGSYHNILGYEAGKRGLKTRYLTKISDVVTAIRSGAVVMSLQTKGTFTGGSGHYILLVGVTSDGRICVNDSASDKRSYFMSGVTYTPATVDNNAKKNANIYYTAVWPDERNLTVKTNSSDLHIWADTSKDESLGSLKTGKQVKVTHPDVYQGTASFVVVKKTRGVDGYKGKYPCIGYADLRYLRLRKDGHWV